MPSLPTANFHSAPLSGMASIQGGSPPMLGLGLPASIPARHGVIRASTESETLLHEAAISEDRSYTPGKLQ